MTTPLQQYNDLMAKADKMRQNAGYNSATNSHNEKVHKMMIGRADALEVKARTILSQAEHNNQPQQTTTMNIKHILTPEARDTVNQMVTLMMAMNNQLQPATRGTILHLRLPQPCGQAVPDHRNRHCPSRAAGRGFQLGWQSLLRR